MVEEEEEEEEEEAVVEVVGEEVWGNRLFLAGSSYFNK